MISMWKVREMVDKATNLVMNYTETEAKVRDATNDDPWGPSGQQMQEVASYTFTYEQFPEVSIIHQSSSSLLLRGGRQFSHAHSKFHFHSPPPPSSYELKLFHKFKILRFIKDSNIPS